MTSKTCQLICDLIYYKIDPNYEELNTLLDQLKTETSQTFDDNVDKWVEWFLSEQFEDYEKRRIKAVKMLYEVHLNLQ